MGLRIISGSAPPVRRRDARPRDVRQDRGGVAHARRRRRLGQGVHPAWCESCPSRARPRKQGCSCAAPGTCAARGRAKASAGAALYSGCAHIGERFGLWALKRGRRRSAPAGRGIPRGPSRVPHGCPLEPARLSHVPCWKPQRAPQRAAATPSRHTKLRRGRLRAAKTAHTKPGLPPSELNPPGLPQHTQAVAATASKPHNAL